jgi:DNA-binding response OmpR family regulator
MAKLFYVEDDENLSYVVKDCLSVAGHDITSFERGDDAMRAFEKDKFDLCILDVMLPGIDGFQLAKHIRTIDQRVPIIFISAKTTMDDKLEGLTLGGDDYIFKPFNLDELLLKVKIFFKRRAAFLEDIKHGNDFIYNIGHFVFDRSSLLLSEPNSTIRLTQREADLLRFFIDNKNKLLRREEMLIAIWGQDDYFLGRSMDVFISRIRKYLSSDKSIQIINIPRVGFEFKVDT